MHIALKEALLCNILYLYKYIYRMNLAQCIITSRQTIEVRTPPSMKISMQRSDTQKQKRKTLNARSKIPEMLLVKSMKRC